MIISMVLSWQDLMAVLLKPGQTSNDYHDIHILLLAQPAYGLITGACNWRRQARQEMDILPWQPRTGSGKHPGGTEYCTMELYKYATAAAQRYAKTSGLGEYFMYYRYNNEYLKRQYSLPSNTWQKRTGLPGRKQPDGPQ